MTKWTRSMASSSLLGSVLKPGQLWLFSGTDLCDFYYTYRISDQRITRNALAMEVNQTTARTFTCFEKAALPGATFRPCLASMAMGDLNSVEFGQESVVLHAGALFPEELLTLSSQPTGAVSRGAWSR